MIDEKIVAKLDGVVCLYHGCWVCLSSFLAFLLFCWLVASVVDLGFRIESHGWENDEL